MLVPSVVEEMTMHNDENFTLSLPKRTPWNKGKLIGPKAPLRQRHVWAIRTKLQIEQVTRLRSKTLHQKTGRPHAF
jgi:hypothetical protein